LHGAVYMFKEVRQGKISYQIVRQVKETIFSGKLKPGDRLPPEKELISQFSVSKNTLREALMALETMGLIDVLKGAGGGAVVREVDSETLLDSIVNFLYFKNVSIKDLSEVRKVLEPHLALQAVNRLDDQMIQRLKEMNQTCREAIRRGEGIIGAEDEIEFHVMLAKASGNPVMAMILDSVNKLLLKFKLDLKPGLDFSIRVINAHEDILNAIIAKKGDAAAKLMFSHVCDVEEDLQALVTNEKIF